MEAVVSLFIMLVFLAAAVAALHWAAAFAERVNARLSAETARADAVARLAAGIGVPLAAEERVTIPGGVAARRISVPGAGRDGVAVVWPDTGRTP